jgi:hypothetical protein
MLHPHQAEEHPLVTGEPLRKWQMRQITEQCDAHLKTIKPPVDNKKWVGNKSTWTPRDSYGMKSV